VVVIEETREAQRSQDEKSERDGERARGRTSKATWLHVFLHADVRLPRRDGPTDDLPRHGENDGAVMGTVRVKLQGR